MLFSCRGGLPCSVLLFVLIQGGPAWLQLGHAQGPASVQVIGVEASPISTTMEFVGTLVPSRRVTIGSAVSGRVLTFAADSGLAVESGAELAQLRTATIEIELASAKAELRLRAAELLERTNGSRPEERQQAEAQLALAANNLRLAERRAARAEALEGVSGAISNEELDSIRSNLMNAGQVERDARAAMELVNNGPRAELIAQAQARVDVQTEAVRLLEDRIRKYTVRSPFAGFVVTEHTEAGAWLQQGDDVAEVIALDPIEVEVFVPQDYIRHIRIGVEVDVTIAASSMQRVATVKRIVPQADRRTRTFPVILRLPNPKRSDGEFSLRPGMTIRADLPAGDSRDGFLVPKDAVVMNGPAATVYRVVDGKAFPVPVTIESAVDDKYEIRDVAAVQSGATALAAGDRVVVKGNERLRPGTPVNVIPITSGKNVQPGARR